MCILVVSVFNVLWGIMNFSRKWGGVYVHGQGRADMQMMLGLGDCELS